MTDESYLQNKKPPDISIKSVIWLVFFALGMNIIFASLSHVYLSKQFKTPTPDFISNGCIISIVDTLQTFDEQLNIIIDNQEKIQKHGSSSETTYLIALATLTIVLAVVAALGIGNISTIYEMRDKIKQDMHEIVKKTEGRVILLENEIKSKQEKIEGLKFELEVSREDFMFLNALIDIDENYNNDIRERAVLQFLDFSEKVKYIDMLNQRKDIFIYYLQIEQIKPSGKNKFLIYNLNKLIEKLT